MLLWRILYRRLVNGRLGVGVDHSSTVRGRRLMREVKRLRESSGMGPDEAARRLDFSKSKLYRIENGKSRIDADDLEDMLDLYDPRGRPGLLQQPFPAPQGPHRLLPGSRVLAE
ncbi:MAG: helix-turn-helix domain-containing protein [Streptosporangiaceae bacterium]